MLLSGRDCYVAGTSDNVGRQPPRTICFAGVLFHGRPACKLAARHAARLRRGPLALGVCSKATSLPWARGIRGKASCCQAVACLAQPLGSRTRQRPGRRQARLGQARRKGQEARHPLRPEPRQKARHCRPARESGATAAHVPAAAAEGTSAAQGTPSPHRAGPGGGRGGPRAGGRGRPRPQIAVQRWCLTATCNGQAYAFL